MPRPVRRPALSRHQRVALLQLVREGGGPQPYHTLTNRVRMALFGAGLLKYHSQARPVRALALCDDALFVVTEDGRLHAAILERELG